MAGKIRSEDAGTDSLMHCETTDPELLESVRRVEDQAAWTRFVQHYGPRIRDHCRSVGLTSDQADEVIQECFIKCFRYLPTFEYGTMVGRFRAWLNLLVNQQIAELFRHSIRTERVKQSYAQLIRGFAPGSSDPVAEPSHYDYEMLSMSVQRTRAQVNPLAWQLFEAHVIEGLNSALVAEHYGVTSVAVRVYALRVKLALRRNWKLLQESPF